MSRKALLGDGVWSLEKSKKKERDNCGAGRKTETRG